MAIDEASVRAQSQLLVQRELELTELREQFGRARSWWGTFQALAAGLDAASTLESTCARWAEILVDELEFQVATVLRVGRDAIDFVIWPEHLGPAPPPITAPSLRAELRAHPRGMYAAPDRRLADLAAALRLERMAWCTISPREGTELIVLAGFDARVARYRPPARPGDLESFEWLARHLETLLRNVLLLQTVARQQQIEAMNAQLARHREELELRLATIGEQAATIRRLSIPVLEIWDGVLVLPLIGSVDAGRGQILLESMLERVVATRARRVILDVTGVDDLDAAAADGLLQAVRAAALVGARCVITGVRPAVAATLAEHGTSLGAVQTFRDLRAGLEACLRAR
jgi:anti-anti-sigma regulatory factor